MTSTTILKMDRDRNGNKTIKIAGANGICGFSIQTLGNLPKTHQLGIHPGVRLEIIEHINNFGTQKQKNLLRHWYPLDVLAEAGLRGHMKAEASTDKMIHSLRLMATEKAIAVFAKENKTTVNKTTMVNLLTNLIHICDNLSIDFYACLSTASSHYMAETET